MFLSPPPPHSTLIIIHPLARVEGGTVSELAFLIYFIFGREKTRRGVLECSRITENARVDVVGGNYRCGTHHPTTKSAKSAKSAKPVRGELTTA